MTQRRCARFCGEKYKNSSKVMRDLNEWKNIIQSKIKDMLHKISTDYNHTQNS